VGGSTGNLDLVKLDTEKKEGGKRDPKRPCCETPARRGKVLSIRRPNKREGTLVPVPVYLPGKKGRGVVCAPSLGRHEKTRKRGKMALIFLSTRRGETREGDGLLKGFSAVSRTRMKKRKKEGEPCLKAERKGERKKSHRLI